LAPVARAKSVKRPGSAGVIQSYFQRRHAWRLIGSTKSPGTHVALPSRLIQISVTSVSPRPSGSENGVGLTGLWPFVDTGACNLGLPFHLGERPAHRCPFGIVPIGVVGRLPVTLKRLRDRNDIGQPLDRRHAVMPRHDGAHRISVIARQILPADLVGDQHVGLQRP